MLSNLAHGILDCITEHQHVMGNMNIKYKKISISKAKGNKWESAIIVQKKSHLPVPTENTVVI